MKPSAQQNNNIPNHINPPPPNAQQQPFANGNGNGLHLNGNSGGNGNGNGVLGEGVDPVANYTLQGVMQWLNGEYRRFERERNAWEIERASLVVFTSEFGDMVDCLGSSFTIDGYGLWDTESSR